MAFPRHALAALLALPLLWPARSVGEPAAPPLAPHRAIYELTLLQGAGARAPMQAQGRIAFDFTGSACDGYVQNFRQTTEVQPDEGASRVSDMHSATFEAGDGHEFRFKIKTTVDDGATEDVDGAAKRGKDGKLSIELTRPKREKRELPAKAIFPTEHIQKILAAARAGQKLLEAQVYDGSGDGSKLFDTLTVIGKPLEKPAPEKAAQLEALKKLRQWPIAVSYFENGKRDETPSYVLSFALYDNGVARALKLDYGDFALAGEMTELTLLPAPKCDK
ncbi:MAG TPA: cell envelope integrity EipB family protein [Methylocystis sp.]|nr:cell envelope integrity EipB family protein [Methylocystis sp.]